MDTNKHAMNSIKKTNRLTLIALLILFAAPVLLAVLMHSNWWQFRPDATRNFGELLEPPVPIAGWPDTQTAPIDSEHEPIWTLLLNSNTDCGVDCREQLTWLRQIRTAQGRHAGQVDIQLATQQPLPVDQRHAIDEIAEEIQLADDQQSARIRQAITQLPAIENPTALTTYLIDPAGFIILRYPENSDADGIRKDLGRLLTWSNKSRN